MKITVFDFDDCIYHWYICDIAIAFYHALQTVSIGNMNEYIKFGEKFIKSFLKENHIEEKWIGKIPLFLEYRRICSYIFILKMWKGKKIDIEQEEYLRNMRYNIVNRVPIWRYN